VERGQRRVPGGRAGDGEAVSSSLRFRNLEVSPAQPVEQWPLEAVLAALERGTLPDWRRLAGAIAVDPWGVVARKTTEALRVTRPYGTAALMEMVVADARAGAAAAERAQVAEEVGGLLAHSGLTQMEFARRIGTSSPRLSTYVSGKVTPSAALLVRMRRVAGAAARVPGATRSSG